ncbi:nucleotide pyrophosphohydrolase [Mariniblastus sp.]|nr:nucleotide pyrophosphohydrolase [Mariniblastus sp.]MDB4374526.1 nucleotide pyrophosphohydrolase [bacterium]MDA7902664.1 nucleotide pyrophosphohydrolase [Mariniblastus sp.]MDA7905838.1 nucleotide pyrophosphohydrolase [Mariniblastus sp.]MDB4380771.1 nucleotide pyrophosphohydrolase [Mariniblastus sp.]
MTKLESPQPNVTLSEFQTLIRNMYLEKDQTRGVPATFMWLMEEVGELASALRETTPSEQSRISPEQWQDRRENLKQEFADVLAWLATIANVVDVDLSEAITEKYGSGCPGCTKFNCICPDEQKP